MLAVVSVGSRRLCVQEEPGCQHGGLGQGRAGVWVVQWPNQAGSPKEGWRQSPRTVHHLGGQGGRLASEGTERSPQEIREWGHPPPGPRYPVTQQRPSPDSRLTPVGCQASPARVWGRELEWQSPGKPVAVGFPERSGSLCFGSGCSECRLKQEQALVFPPPQAWILQSIGCGLCSSPIWLRSRSPGGALPMPGGVAGALPVPVGSSPWFGDYYFPGCLLHWFQVSAQGPGPSEKIEEGWDRGALVWSLPRTGHRRALPEYCVPSCSGHLGDEPCMVPTSQTLEEGCYRHRSDVGCAAHAPAAAGRGEREGGGGRSSPGQRVRATPTFAAARTPAGTCWAQGFRRPRPGPSVLPTEGRLHLLRQGSLLREAHLLAWVFTWTGPFGSRWGGSFPCLLPRSRLPHSPPSPSPHPCT